ncbi:hypothetical protein [Kribbella sp. NPDC048915]|uniref:hypothetical protein n=1 Tax=Kribbella sp. NPDC048915 TaxID=3155148 RepID=UPI0033FBA116
MELATTHKVRLPVRQWEPSNRTPLRREPRIRSRRRNLHPKQVLQPVAWVRSARHTLLVLVLQTAQIP